MHLQGEARRDDVLWLLGSLCGLYRIPFDAALIAQNFPPPTTLGTLHEAARALGIKTGHGARPLSDWQTVPLPAIAFLVPDSTSSSDDLAESGHTDDGETVVEPASPQAPAIAPILIVKASADRLLYFRPGSQTPETMTATEANTRLTPELLLVAKEAAASGQSDTDTTIPGFTTEKKRLKSFFSLLA